MTPRISQEKEGRLGHGAEGDLGKTQSSRQREVPPLGAVVKFQAEHSRARASVGTTPVGDRYGRAAPPAVRAELQRNLPGVPPLEDHSGRMDANQNLGCLDTRQAWRTRFEELFQLREPMRSQGYQDLIGQAPQKDGVGIESRFGWDGTGSSRRLGRVSRRWGPRRMT